MDLMYADGTKAHGSGRKKNEINVIVGKDVETGEKHLLGLTVNRKWKETTGQFKGKAGIMISDADRELRNALIGKALNHQICTNQSERSATHYGWATET